MGLYIRFGSSRCQIAGLCCEIGLTGLVSQAKTVPLAFKDAGIVEQTFYRWRRERGRAVGTAKKLKDLQKENARLRRAVADLTVEKLVLKDIAQGNF